MSDGSAARVMGSAFVRHHSHQARRRIGEFLSRWSFLAGALLADSKPVRPISGAPVPGALGLAIERARKNDWHTSHISRQDTRVPHRIQQVIVGGLAKPCISFAVEDASYCTLLAISPLR